MNADARIEASYDVAVIGAGPAGLTAAATCAKAGVSTVLFDEQTGPGGQIFRGITRSPIDAAILGKSYARGSEIVGAFLESGARYVCGATVWSLTRDRELAVSVSGRSTLTRARRVIACTGALERPMPIPGWTLPGVMTAGAAQGLLKTSGIVGSGRVVFAGSGPLLWLAAWQYLNAGARIDAILETTPRETFTRALPHLPAFLLSSYAREGIVLMRDVKRKVRVISGVESLAVLGPDRVVEVVYGTGGIESRLAADLLFLHHGVTPDVNLAMAAGIEHAWDDVQRCWAPVLNRDGSTSIEGIAIAGDGAGIAGAKAAEFRGTLAALAALRALGARVQEYAERDAHRGLAHALRGRAFIDALYAPAKQFRVPSGDTIVCRCEEVTARTITEAAALGCPGPNQMKSFLRCGMGPCQGRLCGLTVTELIAEARGVSPRDIGYYRLRPPVKPVTVAELAGMSADEPDSRALERG